MVVASRRGLLFLENMSFWIFKTCQISRISTFANIWSNFGFQLQSFVELRAVASNYAGSYVQSRALASRGGSGGGSPQEEVTAATAAAAATVSQELSPFGQAPGPSRPGTKYPVRGIPHFDVCLRTHGYMTVRGAWNRQRLDYLISLAAVQGLHLRAL